MHVPLFVSLIIGLFIGFLAQRSRFCTMGAIRDFILFKQTHLLSGFIAIVGAGISHNFGLASSPDGVGPYGIPAVIIGLLVCLFIGFTMRKQVA